MSIQIRFDDESGRLPIKLVGSIQEGVVFCGALPNSTRMSTFVRLPQSVDEKFPVSVMEFRNNCGYPELHLLKRDTEIVEYREYEATLTLKEKK